MEGRVWGMMGVFVLIACFAAGVSYMFEVDSKRLELSEAQAAVKSLENDLKGKEVLNEGTRDGFEMFKKLIDEHDAITQKKSQLEREIASLEDDKNVLLKSFKDAVLHVRGASVGMAWPDISYKDGQTLREVKIQKATDTEISLSHSEGIIRLSGENLPPDLRARFRIGMVPLVEAPKENAPGGTPTASASNQSVASLLANANLVQVAPGPSQDLIAIAHLQAEIQSHHEKIVLLSRNRDEWANRARDFRTLAQSNSIAGRPTYTANTQATQADQNASAINAQIGKIQSEILSLRKRLAEQTYAR